MFQVKSSTSTTRLSIRQKLVFSHFPGVEKVGVTMVNLPLQTQAWKLVLEYGY